jgi:hypothetical protein
LVSMVRDPRTARRSAHPAAMPNACASDCNLTNTKPGSAIDAARRRSEHDPGTHDPGTSAGPKRDIGIRRARFRAIKQIALRSNPFDAASRTCSHSMAKHACIGYDAAPGRRRSTSCQRSAARWSKLDIIPSSPRRDGRVPQHSSVRFRQTCP